MSTFGTATFGAGTFAAPVPPPLRFRQRHVHKTCVDYIRTGLDTLGWVNPPVNFGTRAVSFVEIQPDEAGVPVQPNTVAVTIGNEPEDLAEELGAGLTSCEYVLFVDVYGIDQSVAVSIASDIKDLLKNTIIGLLDYTSNATGDATTAEIEFDSVVIDKPIVAATGPDKRYWRIVKAIARLYFQE